MKTWRALAADKPAVFSIPADAPFVDALARGILDDAGPDPLALAAVTVLLPTRRACRSLREAFLRLSDGKPLLLPRLAPLNDMDEDDALFASFMGQTEALDLVPAIAPLRRQLLLTRLIHSGPSAFGEATPGQAAHLAAELARLLDQVQTEGLSFDNLMKLVDSEYAEHWQATIQFLTILTEHWPRILRAEGAADPAAQRNTVFAAQRAAWERGGAGGPIIAAGSTGSIPATADLLATIAKLPQGCAVLPGLDRHLDDAAWMKLEETHPQFGIKQLLAHLGIVRRAVKPWPAELEAENTARTRFVSEVMRPASTTDAWRDLKKIASGAIAGLQRIDCASPREEAEVIALIMRESLVIETRTCALITPDRALAQRVAAELKRWAVEIDDSAGAPLAQTPPGSFLRLVAAMVASDFAPVPTLAVCKHPMAAAGLDPIVFRDFTRKAELGLLRGPKPPAGLAGLRALVAHTKEHAELERWIARLEACCGDFAAVMAKPSVSLRDILEAHMAAAEALAGTPDLPGPLRLWALEAGETAAAFAAELAESADALEPLAPAAYLTLFEELMDPRVVRSRYGRHPRLAILGPLEARLQRFDVMILGGLNEGTWPADTTPDPWMSRPMRKAFGLPSPERRIGLAAHDIAQALCAPQVIMTRARKVGGTPTVPSRWLMRLARVIAAAGLEDTTLTDAATRIGWAGAMTRPARIAATLPPAPKPPVKARPRQLSVTEIEKWMRDPYSIYARHVLGLKPLDPLEQDVSAADYGSLVHGALQRFIAAYPKGPLPANAYETLREMGRALFDEQAVRPAVLAFWWPRFERIAAWFVKTEETRRPTLAQAVVETRGEMKIAAPAGPFTLIAKADRIDQAKDGALTIIDYKTGKPPSDAEVRAGFAPQLPLEAAITAAGGFANVPGRATSTLSYWYLHGRGEGADQCDVKADAGVLTEEAIAGLAKLIAAFDDPKTAYEARPNPETAPVYSDYLHLARVKEWSSSGEGDA